MPPLALFILFFRVRASHWPTGLEFIKEARQLLNDFQGPACLCLSCSGILSTVHCALGTSVQFLGLKSDPYVLRQELYQLRSLKSR